MVASEVGLFEVQTMAIGRRDRAECSTFIETTGRDAHYPVTCFGVGTVSSYAYWSPHSEQYAPIIFRPGAAADLRLELAAAQGLPELAAAEAARAV